jgi:hypothetical protein
MKVQRAIERVEAHRRTTFGRPTAVSSSIFWLTILATAAAITAGGTSPSAQSRMTFAIDPEVGRQGRDPVRSGDRPISIEPERKCHAERPRKPDGVRPGRFDGDTDDGQSRAVVLQ